jgi:hypothetical protein
MYDGFQEGARGEGARIADCEFADTVEYCAGATLGDEVG